MKTEGLRTPKVQLLAPIDDHQTHVTYLNFTNSSQSCILDHLAAHMYYIPRSRNLIPGGIQQIGPNLTSRRKRWDYMHQLLQG